MTSNTGQFKKGQRRSPATEFKKGGVPWNKGKYCRWSPETEFKDGHIPANTRPMYAKRIVTEGKRCKRKACQIKVHEKGRWEYLARYVWTQAGNTVPKGYVMYHKDGNGLNDELSNLECISRSELLRRNSRN